MFPSLYCLYWMLVFFFLCLHVHMTNAETVVVTQFNMTTVDRGLLFFRSLWAHASPSGHIHEQLSGHACFDGSNADMIVIAPLFGNLGVRLHNLDAHTSTVSDRNTTEWLQLRCVSQIADALFMAGRYDVNVLFIANTFIVINNLETSLLSSAVLGTFNQNPTDTSFVYCLPKLVTLDRALPLSGACETDILLLPSRIGTTWYAMLNATRYANLTAHDAIGVYARSLTRGILFWDRGVARGVIRAGREWIGNVDTLTVADFASLSVVEFDNYQHRVTIERGCVMKLHVEWPMFNTLDLIMLLFGGDYQRYQMTGCADDSFGRSILLPDISKSISNSNSNSSSEISRSPRVFDTVMINNELDLLLLRIETMRDYCDAHIVVESAVTFTGKPKPLHFDQNKHLFAEHLASGRLIHVVIPAEAMLYLPVSKPMDVWMNEYHSRNQVDIGLRGLGAADNDVIILADVDEIPHRRAVASVVALQRYHQSRGTQFDKVFKLFPQNYIYNFDCNVGAEETFSAGAAAITTIGYAKSLPFKPQTPFTSDNYITTARMHQQSIYPYEYDMVLFPGGWHLSFFGGAARIKNKLESYSHQNFVRQFVDKSRASSIGSVDSVVDENAGACSAGATDSEEQQEACKDLAFASGKPVLDASGHEIIPKVLPPADAVISTALIEDKIARGVEIDNREKRRCVNRPLDEETRVLKTEWERITTYVSARQQ